jgi:hypothetical protein
MILNSTTLFQILEKLEITDYHQIVNSFYEVFLKEFTILKNHVELKIKEQSLILCENKCLENELKYIAFDIILEDWCDAKDYSELISEYGIEIIIDRLLENNIIVTQNDEDIE